MKNCTLATILGTAVTTTAMGLAVTPASASTVRGDFAVGNNNPITVKMTVNFSHGVEQSVTGVLNSLNTIYFPLRVDNKQGFLTIPDKFGHGSTGQGRGIFSLSNRVNNNYTLSYFLESLTKGACKANKDTCSDIDTTVSASYATTANPAVFIPVISVKSDAKEVPEPELGAATLVGAGLLGLRFKMKKA